MEKLRALSLKTKLRFCLSFLSIFALVIGVTGVGSIKSVTERGGKIYSEGLIPCLYITQIEQNLTDIHTYYLHIAYGGQSADLTKLKEKIDANDAFIGSYATYAIEPDEQVLYQKLEEAFDTYQEKVYSHVNQIQIQGISNSKNLMNEVISCAESVQVILNSLMEVAQTTALERSNENESNGNTAEMTLIIIIVVGILISTIAVSLIIKTITKEMDHIIKVVEEVANGNLDVQSNINTKSEIGMISKNLNKMIGSLREVVVNIEAASEQVHMGAKQVAHTSSLLAQGATEQATTVEELTAAVEEINAQIKQNADHAHTMNDIATHTKTVVEKSHVEMEQMLKAMEDINDSSGEISKIIKVIDDIAFQTNILALNAAVEAARAGQHGKGFAVVAEEVRNLAAKSAEAAKETTSMIESSIKNARVGMELAQGTANELSHVVEGIKEVVELTSEISSSCTEQSIGIEQINEGTIQISNVIQSNSATSQEAAAASEELAGQAELMRGEVSRFRTNRRYTSHKMPSIYNDEIQYKDSSRQAAKIGDTEFGKY